MTTKRTGTFHGSPITDEVLDDAARYFEKDFKPGRVRYPGRPALEAGESPVERVRIGASLRQALRDRAEKEGRPRSALIRTALEQYLGVSSAPAHPERCGKWMPRSKRRCVLGLGHAGPCRSSTHRHGVRQAASRNIA